MTKANVLIDNDKIKVSDWSFEILDKNNIETISKLSKGGAYYRDKREEHNVFNNNNSPYSFIEIELIK